MEAAAAYLDERGIYGLVEYLLAELMLQQPAKPFEWLAERVLQLQRDNVDPSTVSTAAAQHAATALLAVEGMWPPRQCVAATTPAD